MSSRLQALNQLSAELSNSASEADLLSGLAQRVHGSFGIDWAGLALRSADGVHFRLIALDPTRVDQELGSDRPGDHLAANEVIKQQGVLYEPNLSSSRHLDLISLVDRGLSSALVVPLTVGDLSIGAITVARAGVDGFTDDDRLVLLQAAAFIASVIKGLRSAEELERATTEHNKVQMVTGRRMAELDALNRMSLVIGRADIQESLVHITNEISGLRGIEVCRITAVDEAGRLSVVAGGAQHGVRFQDDAQDLQTNSPDAKAIETGATVLWRRPGEDQRSVTEALRRIGLTSLFSLPIRSGSTALGAITAGSTGGHRLVTDEHLVMAEIVAGQLVAAVTGPGGDGRLVRANPLNLAQV